MNYCLEFAYLDTKPDWWEDNPEKTVGLAVGNAAHWYQSGEEGDDQRKANKILMINLVIK